MISFFRCKRGNVLSESCRGKYVFCSRRIGHPQRKRLCRYRGPLVCIHSTHRSPTWQVSNHVHFTTSIGCYFQDGSSLLQPDHVIFGRGRFPQRPSCQHSFRTSVSQDDERAPCHLLEGIFADAAVSIQHERYAYIMQERCKSCISSDST